MMDSIVSSSRVRPLNHLGFRAGRYVLYWMQQSQRADWNHALEYAIRQANDLSLPVLVGFALDESYPEANLRHFQFMWEGLVETSARLRRRNIPMVLRRGSPLAVILEMSQEAACLVCDRGYLRHQKAWRQEVARYAGCRVVQVESDVVVPVDEASNRVEFAARTIRPKLNRVLDRHLVRPEESELRVSGLTLPLAGEDFETSGWLDRLRVDRSLPPVSKHFKGGTTEARRQLRRFLEQVLPSYSAHRNQPQFDSVSGLSPYLHFGQISPLEPALAVRQRIVVAPDDVAVFLEELIVRRELAVNFVEFCPDYDRYTCLPAWAAQTLDRHAGNPRPRVYDYATLAAAATHDAYWNAAMLEMTTTGFMHNSMRMYWGKKILEWSPNPRTGYETALALNNRYFLDGRDANSYAGVGWVFGLHDRPWGEREIFGTVRYMAASGLERKCDIRGYVDRVRRLARRD